MHVFIWMHFYKLLFVPIDTSCQHADKKNNKLRNNNQIKTKANAIYWVLFAQQVSDEAANYEKL